MQRNRTAPEALAASASAPMSQYTVLSRLEERAAILKTLASTETTILTALQSGARLDSVVDHLLDALRALNDALDANIRSAQPA